MQILWRPEYVDMVEDLARYLKAICADHANVQSSFRF